MKLIRAVMGKIGFSTDSYLQAIKEEMCKIKKTWYGINDAKIKGIVKELNTLYL